MQTMDADLARLVRTGKITRSLAEQRASVPEELKRLLGGTVVEAPAALGGAEAAASPSAGPPGNGVPQAPPPQVAPAAYTQGG
jgi:hypothetical protein